MSGKALKTVNIKGKEYVMVNERLKYFREHFPDFALVTIIVELTPERVCMEAKILNPDGSIVANGHAFEEKQSSYINKTSYIENCETSAWGRALANFGIGIDDSVGSADEVAHAMALQDSREKNDAAKKSKAKQKNEDFEPQGDLGFLDSDAYAEQRIDIIKAETLLNVMEEYNTICNKNSSAEKICAKFGVSAVTELSLEQWKSCMDSFDAAIKAAEDQQ